MLIRRIQIVTALTVAGTAGLLGAVGVASAASAAAKAPSLAQEIATKFNLNPGEVQGVISGHRQQAYATRLQRLVAAGKISSGQVAGISAEHTAWVTFVASLKGKTAAERKTALQQERQSLQQWATQNSIAGYPIKVRYITRG